MLDMKDINALGAALNPAGSSPDGQSSCIARLADNKLILKFNQVVHFASEQSLQLQMEKLADEAVQRMDAKLKEIKDHFKEARDKALKTKDVASDDGLEMISNPLNPVKVAVYRRHHIVEITN
tara:strand:- start:289 stop:657 length:369 start_codon:yes stop_codon:yes gene_type:complete